MAQCARDGGLTGDTQGMDFSGKRVIAIGERDGVQGYVIAEVAQELGAEVVFNITQCFV